MRDLFNNVSSDNSFLKLLDTMKSSLNKSARYYQSRIKYSGAYTMEDFLVEAIEAIWIRYKQEGDKLKTKAYWLKIANNALKNIVRSEYRYLKYTSEYKKEVKKRHGQ